MEARSTQVMAIAVVMVVGEETGLVGVTGLCTPFQPTHRETHCHSQLREVLSLSASLPATR